MLRYQTYHIWQILMKRLVDKTRVRNKTKF
uniref:Uncharacterized protein n=1 Tax=Anguilla anguilla TaxID=7936 RepID=A0A0E9SQD4_ANGAN